MIFPLLTAYAIDTVDKKPTKNIISNIPLFTEKLEKAG